MKSNPAIDLPTLLKATVSTRMGTRGPAGAKCAFLCLGLTRLSVSGLSVFREPWGVCLEEQVSPCKEIQMPGPAGGPSPG